MTTYKLRIGDYGVGAVKDVDYLEFYADGDPMPRIMQGRTNVYNQDGTQISTNYDVSMKLMMPCDANTDVWERWTAINKVLDSTVHDIRLYYNNALVMSYIKNGTDSNTQVKCFNSPRVDVLANTEGKGQWATYLEFDVRFYIETDADRTNILELDRTKQADIQDGRTSRRWQISARGVGAEAQVLSFMDEAQSNGRLTMQSITQNVDSGIWTGVFTIDADENKLIEVKETIRVSGGGRDKSFTATLSDSDPYEFDETKRHVIIEIDGEVIAGKPELLVYPDRSNKPGHVPDDDYSFGNTEADAEGRSSSWRGIYRQVFKLANKDRVQEIIELPRDATTMQDGRTIRMLLQEPTAGGAALKEVI